MRHVLAVCLAGAVLAAAGSASAAHRYTYWQADPAVPGDWFEAAHWTDGVPVPGVYAMIDNGGAAEILEGAANTIQLRLGEAASGAVRQTGGVTTITDGLYLGYNPGSYGAYTLAGGELRVRHIAVGRTFGSGSFVQTGGVNRIDSGLSVGDLDLKATLDDFDQSLAVYDLSGGEIQTGNTSVGIAGHGLFIQSGGLHAVESVLRIGNDAPPPPLPWPDPILIDLSHLMLASADGAGIQRAPGPSSAAAGGLTVISFFSHPPAPSEGRYNLSGGQLKSHEQYIGETGAMRQTGGANATAYLDIDRGGRYEYLGGSLEVTEGLALDGVLDFGGSYTTLAVDHGLLDFGRGQVAGAENATLTAGRDSLIIVAPGFNPYTEFGRFRTAGMVHVAGRDLYIASNRGFTGWGQIDDYVVTAGHILASPGGRIDLKGGLYVRRGTVDLGDGVVSVGDARSGILRGSLRADSMGLRQGTIAISGHGPAAARPPMFVQQGGSVALAKYLTISEGTYMLRGGTLSADLAMVGGPFSTGDQAGFVQTGGTATINTLRVGRYTPDNPWFHSGSGDTLDLGPVTTDLSGVVLPPVKKPSRPSTSTYTMHAGRLAVAFIDLYGEDDRALFTQTGGSVDVARWLEIGGHDSTYAMHGGRLTAEALRVGYRFARDGTQTLAILRPQAEIRVSENLLFGPGSRLKAVRGATIHMDAGALGGTAGAMTFENLSTDPGALAGFSNLRLIFEGGGEAFSTLEVAGEDLGFSLAGFHENFAFDTLRIGGAEAANLRLVDLFDNQPDWTGAEALYVRNLVIGEGSWLDLNGLNIYYLHASLPSGSGGIDESGGVATAMQLLPEPGTLAFLALGAAVALGRRRHRAGPGR
ncbi:MAG: hypothetical protein IMZ66_08175 [Planctomycetes bacterium]|nr:hypothetical protein [Planctomycetota bacterium]